MFGLGLTLILTPPPKGAGAPDDWILAAGSWNDGGYWRDGKTWNDS